MSSTMNRRKNLRSAPRRGAVMVLVLVSLVALLTFVALAIDLGVLAVARTQLQDAADAAAMAGTRTLNGKSGNNYSNASPNAISAATANTVLTAPITTNNVALQIGRYVYVSGNQRFEGQFPGPSTENWSLVQATVSANISNNLAFSRVFNFTGSNIQAVATAAHRPRDIALILDYSGSMRFASLMGTPYSGDRTTNSGDSVIPSFGHYSSSSAGLQATSFTNPYDAANITTTTSDGRAPIVGDFYSDANGTAAFSPQPSSYGTTPDGDDYFKSGSTVRKTVAEQLGLASNLANSHAKNTTFEAAGYGANFKAYTMGPGYWGKTFFIWPPDPRTSNHPTSGLAYDWRIAYFGTNDNSRLWDSSGNWRAPSGSTYTINYAAILSFIKNNSLGTNPFPSTLRSGRILYYDAIPSTINTATWPPTDLNQRFWKDYIDYCLGLVQTGSSSWTVITSGTEGPTGYGPDFAWGTTKITAMSSLTANPKPYMHYNDNPLRPRTHFWFGPMTMVDFLGNYNLWNTSYNSNNSRFCWWPGTCHEAPMYACKLGIRAGLQDIEDNHPNDLVSLIMFSTPMESANDGGRFNRPRVGLSRDYTSMQESLWYPSSTIGNSNATMRPYDSDNLEVPRAMGGTCYSMGLMLAYNQFSANTSLVNYNPGKPAGDAGGKGRKGAQKLIIFETDGSPNTTATASLNNLGTYNSYYSIRYNSSNPSASQFPTTGSSNVTTQINSLCTQLCALETASPPGYSSPSKKLQIHCIAFGPVVAPGGSQSAAAISVLNGMQTISGITDNMPSYKVIYGTESQVTSALEQAFTKILQSGVQVSLIQ